MHDTFDPDSFAAKIKGKILAGENPTDIRKYIRHERGLGKTQGNDYYNKIDKSLTKKERAAIPRIEVETVFVNVEGFQDHGDTAVAEIKGVSTLDGLIEAARVDLEVWEMVKSSVGVWKGDWSIRAEFKKKQNLIDLKEIVEDFKIDLSAKSQKVPLLKRIKSTSGKLLEVCAFDLHLGKLGWDKSDGQNYDLEIAERVFKDSIISIVEKAKNFGEFEKVVFPIGNDYLTCDNSHNTTFASTPQSVDSRFPKIFKKGREMLVWAIDLLKQIAPVDVVYVVSNHDTDSMFHMSDAIDCWYRNDENVKVDSNPAPRKYYRFGEVVIAYAHGDKIALNKLPTLATVEYREWSMCKHREIHTGDKHHEKALVADENSCIIRIVPSLSGNDNYHTMHGYIGAKQRAQGFVWDKNDGLDVIIYSKSQN